MTNTPTPTNRSTFATADAERRAIEAIPTLSLTNSPRIGMIFQCSSEPADPVKRPFGLLEGIAKWGIYDTVRTWMVPEAGKREADFIALHLPTSRGDYDDTSDMSILAPFDLRERGFYDAVDPSTIGLAGDLIRASGFDAYAYVGTGRRDPRLMTEPNTPDRERAIDLALEAIRPYIDGGFKIILDSAGEAKEGGFTADLANELVLRGCFGGIEPRPEKGSVWETRPYECWAQQFFDPNTGVPRLYFRSDPGKYRDSQNLPNDAARETIIWPIDGGGKAMSDNAIIHMVARGWSVAIETSCKLTATEIRERAGEVREQMGREPSNA